jgi:hypothetical protein
MIMLLCCHDNIITLSWKHNMIILLLQHGNAMTKCTQKKFIQKNYFLILYTLCSFEILLSGITFLGAFCHQGKFIFLTPMLNSASFDTHKSHIMKKKNFDPYILLCLTKKLSFCCFQYFYIKMNIFQGYSHSNSNFCQKSTHPIGYLVR